MKMYDADLLWVRITEKNLDVQIKILCQKQNHSYGMILDWLKKDYKDLLEGLTITRKSLKRILTNNGIHFNLQKYNTTSNFWKLQYRADKSQIEKWARQGQKKTIKIRKDHVSGWKNSKQSSEYYISIGFSPKEAEIKKKEFTRSNSPFCEEFYLRRGWSYEDAHEKLTNDRVSAALRSLSKTQKPKTESKIAKLLDERNISYLSQFSLENSLGFDKRKKVIFDFYLPSQNKLIEANGTFWHADPRCFKPDDEISFPGNRNFLAKEIWNRDERKRKIALEQGYKVLTLWEKEIFSLDDLFLVRKINE